MSIELLMPSNHLILCHPFLLPPSIFPCIRVSSNESILRIRWPKYWTLSISISPFNEYSRLSSFRMDWLDHLAGHGTLKCFLQHHSSKASILQRSAFFIVQLSHPYMITGKTIALTKWTFVGKVVSLFFNKLSRLVITFLPRSKHDTYKLLSSFLFTALNLSPLIELSYWCIELLSWFSGKEYACNAGGAGNAGLIPGSGNALEDEMVTHSSTLAWKIPWTEESGVQFTGVTKHCTWLRMIGWLRMHALMDTDHSKTYLVFLNKQVCL